MREAATAGRASRVVATGVGVPTTPCVVGCSVEDAARRLRRSAAAILDPGDADPRWDDVAATEELGLEPNRGTAEGLRLEASFALIREAAEERRFVSYGDVAAASDMAWNAARRRMDPHLYDLCRRATERGWPLLSALVVDKPSVPHGAMRGRPLIGFARAAERCGRIIGGDAASFLAEEQERVFAWANREKGHVLHA